MSSEVFMYLNTATNMRTQHKLIKEKLKKIGTDDLVTKLWCSV
jgi:hypothetical protein